MSASSLPYGAVLVLLGVPVVGWAQTDPPSARAQAALNRAKAAIEVLFDLSGRRDDFEQAPTALEKALDDLAKAVDEGTAQRLTAAEAESMDAKLVAIAWDRRLHPERHRELLKTYRGGGDTLVLVSPPPEERHLKEEYRLAWEYRLLNPQVGEGTSKPLPPTFEALRRIGNEASIPTLVYYYCHVCRDDDERFLFNTRTLWARQALESYCSAKGLAALLECVAWTKRQWAKQWPDRNFSSEWLADLLWVTSHPETHEQWRKVMTDYPRDKLPAEQGRWLDDALKKR